SREENGRQDHRSGSLLGDRGSLDLPQAPDRRQSRPVPWRHLCAAASVGPHHHRQRQRQEARPQGTTQAVLPTAQGTNAPRPRNPPAIAISIRNPTMEAIRNEPQNLGTTPEQGP